MTVVYIDEVFLLNALVDYLLLLAAARLAGEPLRRLPMAAAAALGGGYAAAVMLPRAAFLSHPLCALGVAAGMCLVAFGRSRRLLRVSLVFLGASAAFGGGVFALQLAAGVSVFPDLKSILLAAAGCFAFLDVVFRRTARHGGRELAPAVLTLGGRRCALTALLDTGNTLTDPATGKPVMVAEGRCLSPLFPAGCAPSPKELSDPITALTVRRGDGLAWRLLPYRAVGVDCGLLLAVRVDGAQVGKRDWGSILVALAPGQLSDGGGYNALMGGYI